MHAKKQAVRRRVWLWGMLAGLVVLGGAGMAHADGPDLREQSVGDPPARVVAGTGFSATDTVINQGTVKTAVSTTRYYLSTTAGKDSGSLLLGGRRNVKILKPGAKSSGKTKVTVPSGTAPGTYYFLACADDTARVAESDETNNCLAAASQLTVPAYSQADLTGTWTVNSLASGPGAPWWIRGAVTISSSGKVTGLLMGSDGGKDKVSLTFSISAEGLLIIPGSDQAHCRMDAGKTFMACTGTWDDGTAELITLSKKPAKTSLSDLAGSWSANLLASGPEEPWWERGILACNSQGQAVFSGVQSTGEPDSWSQTLKVSKDGAISIADSRAECRLDFHKTVMTCTDTWDDGTTSLILGAKVGASYSMADVEGLWDMNMLASGPSAPLWVRGVVTVEADGSFQMTSKDNGGFVEDSAGSLEIDQNGVVLVEEMPFLECRMDAGKTVMFCTDTLDDGSTALFAFTKNPVPHSLQ